MAVCNNMLVEIKKNNQAVMKSIIIVFLLLVSMSHAQVISWSAVPGSCDRVRVYAIDTFPPIYPGMDWSVAITLAVADTLAKSLSSVEYIEAIKQVSDDSLRLALKKMNDVRKYDPLLFKILFTQRLEQYPHGYRQSYGDVMHNLTRERVRREGRYDDTTTTILNFDGGVYFVHINSITHRADKGRRLCGTQEDSITSYYWCAKASINDKIIGEKVHEVYPNQEGGLDEVLSITWSSEEGGPSIYDPSTPEYFEKDSHFLREGRDYIVFLDCPFSRRGDGSWDVSYAVVVRLACTNGFVSNPDEFLNMGTLTPYSDVKDHVLSIFSNLDK